MTGLSSESRPMSLTAVSTSTKPSGPHEDQRCNLDERWWCGCIRSGNMGTKASSIETWLNGFRENPADVSTASSAYQRRFLPLTAAAIGRRVRVAKATRARGASHAHLDAVRLHTTTTTAPSKSHVSNTKHESTYKHQPTSFVTSQTPDWMFE